MATKKTVKKVVKGKGKGKGEKKLAMVQCATCGRKETSTGSRGELVRRLHKEKGWKYVNAKVQYCGDHAPARKATKGKAKAGKASKAKAGKKATAKKAPKSGKVRASVSPKDILMPADPETA